MSGYVRNQHRRLDAACAEADARDGGADGQADIARPPQWRQDNASGNRPREPKVLLLTLSERTSARGNRYMRGWLGRAAVIAFQGEKDEAGNATWDIYVSTPEPRDDRPREKASA